jgi:PAS domain S-box-containing protein
LPRTDHPLIPSLIGDRDSTPEQQIETERLLLATMVDSSHDAILTKTLQGIITSWNAAAERLYGYTAQEAIGQSVTLIIPPDQPDEFPAIMARLQRGERVDHYETVRQHKDGHRIDISLTVSPLVAADGTILGASAVARDISEHKQLEADRQDQEAALRASEEKYRSLFNSIGQGFCLLEVLVDDAEQPIDLRYLEVNPAFEHQTGLQDAAGRTATELYGGLDAGWLRTVAGVAQTGESVRYEDYVPSLNRWFDVYFFRVREPRERTVAAIFTDITERRQLEAARDAFFAAITHDLKNPLTTARGMAQFLQRRLERAGTVDANQLSEGLRSIQAATQRTVNLVDTLLDIALLRSGQHLELQYGAVDLAALARACVAEHQQLAPTHELLVKAEVATLTGEWDERRLERVLTNLLSNAVKYSPDGGQVTVSIRVDEPAAQAVLTVRDQGVGIPAADIPKLFAPFHRGSNVVGRIAGSGIGLMNVKQIVEQHGGAVTVESSEGVGTAVSVRLPLHPPALQAGTSPVSAPSRIRDAI